MVIVPLKHSSHQSIQILKKTVPVLSELNHDFLICYLKAPMCWLQLALRTQHSWLLAYLTFSVCWIDPTLHLCGSVFTPFLLLGMLCASTQDVHNCHPAVFLILQGLTYVLRCPEILSSYPWEEEWFIWWMSFRRINCLPAQPPSLFCRDLLTSREYVFPLFSVMP